MVVILVFVLCESILFAETYAQNYFHISAPVTLNFDLFTPKLFCLLLLTWVIYIPRLNDIWFSVFMLMLGRIQMDRQMQCIMWPLGDGCIIISHTCKHNVWN